jgi:hypothetical protein
MPIEIRDGIEFLRDQAADKERACAHNDPVQCKSPEP